MTIGRPGTPHGRTAVRGARTDTGQAAVEFAIAFPLVILAVLAVLQIALIVRDQLAVGLVAREAARAASVTSDLGAAASTASSATAVDGIEVSIVESDDVVVATATKHGATAVPLLGALAARIELSATATMLIEPPP